MEEFEELPSCRSPRRRENNRRSPGRARREGRRPGLDGPITLRGGGGRGGGRSDEKMSHDKPFPPYQEPSTTLSKQEVINYLLGISASGIAVFATDDGFAIPLDEVLVEVTSLSDGSWVVRNTRMGILSTFGYAKKQTDLERLLSIAAVQGGKSWPFHPTSGRLSADKPATNYRTISDLIGSSMVEAVFDPYLDNHSLPVLIDILSFGGGGVVNGVRLLGSARKTQGAIPQLTRTGVTAWLSQLGITGEGRVIDPMNEHRRFLLLSGRQSLILGPSLNSIHKNEAVRKEPDTEDRPFFDSAWGNATLL
jgi:hypothetical protein